MCILNCRSAIYICNASPGRKTNLRCALLVNCCSAAHICEDGYGTSKSGTLGLPEPPEQNARLSHLWLVDFYILIIQWLKKSRLADVLQKTNCCVKTGNWEPTRVLPIWILKTKLLNRYKNAKSTALPVPTSVTKVLRMEPYCTYHILIVCHF